ncbi:hypothetical protein A6V39_01105 [Candidatus Mycoplasma haematobovis]|uniref:Uncharacterized protein n=1 Tax=Candidatus Mycoplasma haematobovis TaxID=432608 RepID=A0A1A9QF63_9MOLU|nr:hypothetical protein [Candidatus Mycoplasma haematobovis]OAL10651.1 hypothetical protein A6V39_01105 [Candidatus Mycoplasma haematobovis]
MFPLIKLLKIVLPVTTVTAATIATVSLVSFQKADNKLDKETTDKVLEDFEKPVEEFKEQTMLYAKDGQGDNVAIKDEKQKQQLLEELEKNKGHLKQTDEPIKELRERGSNDPSEGQQIENKAVDVPKAIDLEGELSGSGQPEADVQINLPPMPDPSSDLTDDDSEKSTPQEGAEDSENLGDSEKKFSEPKRTGESVDSDEGVPTADIKSQEPVQDMPEKNGESTETDSLDREKDTLPSVQENGDGSEDNEDVSSKVDAQKESKGDNFGGDESNSSQGEQDGVSNESGREPVTKEKLDELIRLGDGAAKALDDLKRLLLG